MTTCTHEWEHLRSTGEKSLVMRCLTCAEELEIEKHGSDWSGVAMTKSKSNPAYQIKAVPVEAWQWNGEGRAAWPAWVQDWHGGERAEQISITVDNNGITILRVPARWTVKFCEAGQWLARSSIGARDIEVHSDEMFWDKYQRVT